MNDEHEHIGGPVDDDGSFEPTSIGVGMGGSCPNCRAPVDLGQEFCLECGAPIRFTPRQRRAQRRPAGAAPVAAAVPPPGRSGFPWIPFLVVLALIGGGVLLALVGGDGGSGKGDKSSGSDKGSLPTITNDVPETTASSTQTQTLTDCDPLQPLNQLEPATGGDASSTDPAAADPALGGTDSAQPGLADGTGEQIPELGDGTSTDSVGVGGFDDGSGVPSTEPGTSSGSSGATVTVNQNGDICPSDGSSSTPTTETTDTNNSTDTTSTTSTDTTGTTGTTGTDTTSTTGSTASGGWPTGKQGWTVVVAGYGTRDRAEQRAADVQEDGFNDGGVLFSTDYKSLCPGIYVVFSGVFESESKAKSRMSELTAKNYAGMYVREIRTDGSRPAGCKTVT